MNRSIAHQSSGYSLGPITRFMTPNDLGDFVKPFVFLDFFELPAGHRQSFAPHPHSGIATLTAFFEGTMTYNDTTGKRGSMADNSVEWMRAGSGVWHAGASVPGHKMRGFQLWVALPPELELTPAQSLYITSDNIESSGPARILLGHYNGKTSPIPYPESINYLHVRLQDGEQWSYHPPQDHDVAWIAVNSGTLRIGDEHVKRRLAAFSPGNQAIHCTAVGDTEFVLGSATKHPYPLINSPSSVHTSKDALRQGEQMITDIRNKNVSFFSPR